MDNQQREKLRQIDREIQSAAYWIEAERRRLEDLRKLRDRFLKTCEPECCEQCKSKEDVK